MNYTQKLTISIPVLTGMVAKAGSAIVIGAAWLQARASAESSQAMTNYLSVGATDGSLIHSLSRLVTVPQSTLGDINWRLKTFPWPPTKSQRAIWASVFARKSHQHRGPVG